MLQFATEVGRLIEAKLTDPSIQLACDFEPSIGNCRIDPGYIHAALLNIVENALDACRREQSRKVHQITFSVHSDQEHIVFCVADDGIGMDTETQAKLFTEFFSSKGRKGTGLGLFIANQIIQQHGGTISVSSAPGRGSRFTIKLPKQCQPQ